MPKPFHLSGLGALENKKVTNVQLKCLLYFFILYKHCTVAWHGWLFSLHYIQFRHEESRDWKIDNDVSVK